MWGLAERKTSRLGRDLDIDDLYDQLDVLRGYVQDLSRGASRGAGESLSRAREFASDAARDAEETMKDHLAVSLVMAMGLGVVVGYLLWRASK